MTYPQFDLYSDDMDWVSFRAKLIGLSGNTPLGRVIQIRSETDPEILKTYSKDMRKIRDDWLSRQAKAGRESINTDGDNVVAVGAHAVQQALHQLFGGSKGGQR